MQARIILLIALVAIAFYLGRDTYAQYTFNPYALHVCTGMDYGDAGAENDVCLAKDTTITVQDQKKYGAYLEISHAGFHGTHDVRIQIARQQPDGSWRNGPPWVTYSAPNTTTNPNIWIYRTSLTLFWPAQWQNYAPKQPPTVQPGAYQLSVVLDGQQSFSTYNLKVTP